MTEIFNILPKATDTHLHFRFRFFFRIKSFTSAISDFPMAYVDWIHLIEHTLETPLLTVGKISENEWNTGPKQRNNQWSCPPFVLLDKIFASRYAIGLDPSTSKSRNKVVSLISLDPERVRSIHNPSFMMDLGDRKFAYYQQTKSRFAANSGDAKENEEEEEYSCDGEDSIASTSPLACAIPPNVMDFLEYY
jgi:hypothetical protein